jgi:hypothetical protein
MAKAVDLRDIEGEEEVSKTYKKLGVKLAELVVEVGDL